MISAAKLRRAQERAIAARPYANILQQMLANVAAGGRQSADAGETSAAGRSAGKTDSG